MAWRALILALFLLPVANGHGDPPAYDPLVVEWHAFLQADGTVAEAAGAEGTLAFPASTPAAPGAPLRFAFAAPVRFAPAGGFSVELTVRADAPVATGEGLELAIEPGGAPKRVALPPLMAPGELAAFGVKLDGAAEYAAGTAMTLSIRALAPALAEGALSIVLGEGAHLDALDMRIPSVADLALQDPGSSATEFLLGAEAFAPPAPATVHTIDVRHGAVGAPTKTGDANATYVVLRGAEEGSDAQSHAFPDRERRVGAAHAFTVGQTLVRVHPGVGVAVRLAGTSARVTCVANCPPGGFSMTVGTSTTSPTADRPSALIPPERETRDIPTSADEAPTKSTPLGGALAGAALLVALASRRRR